MRYPPIVIHRNPRRPLSLPLPVIATLGNLDGVHRGHQSLCAATQHIRDARSADGKGNSTTMAITFYPHPNVVLGKALSQTTLSPLRVKARVLSEHGIEHLVLIRFTRALANMGAQDFIRTVLWEMLGVQHLVIGPDAHVGFRREGTPDMILTEFRGAGRAADIVPFVELEGARVSSREVRAALEQGAVSRAHELLGRPFEISGRVVRGDGRGKGIGFPTANISHGKTQLPRFGVYGGLFVVEGGKSFRAVCNIGVRPTFRGQRPSVEAFLPDYGGDDFYGRRVSLQLISRIRDERRFSGVEELKAQIASDVAEVCRLIPTPPGASLTESV